MGEDGTVIATGVIGALFISTAALVADICGNMCTLSSPNVLVATVACRRSCMRRTKVPAPRPEEALAIYYYSQTLQ